MKDRWFNQSTLLFLIVIGVLSHCSKDRIQNPQNRVLHLTILSGNNQIGVAGENLNLPIRVQVKNLDQLPVADVAVLFKSVEGGGTTSSPTMRTNGSGIAEVMWKIGPNYNVLEVVLLSSTYEAGPCYIYAETENPSGLNSAKTLNSLRKLNNLYEMTFYGDYSSILDRMNRKYGGADILDANQFYCSLFTAFGNPNMQLLGRSYDLPIEWPECLVLICRTNPPDGYASITPVRLREIGFPVGTDFDNMLFIEKKKLLDAVFYCPDGINEHGVVAGLANYPSHRFVPDPSKSSIYIHLLVREILDHARNVEEAIEIANQYNIFSSSTPHETSIEIHTMVADPSDKSAILEFSDGELRIIPNTESWQVMTNSPIHNRTIDEMRSECVRFKKIYDSLQSVNGNIDWESGMNILTQVCWPSTAWSAIYDMTNKKIILAHYCDFENLYHISLNNE